jgi:hypothetical protein
MTGPRHLKLALILVALLLALAIVGEARADVTSSPPADTSTLAGPSTSTTSTSTSTQNVSGPGPTESSTPMPTSSDPSPAGSDPVPLPAGPAPVSTGPAPVSTSPAPVSTGPAPVSAEPVTASAPVSTDPTPGSTSDPAPPDQAPDPPATDDQPTTTGGPSTDTSQVILQVQVSGCLSHCQGTSQTQAAQQQNVTVQGAPPGPSTGQSPAGPQSQGSANATQIQLGCRQDCSGTSLDTTAQVISPGTLSQLLAAVGSQTLPGQPPIAPGAQSGVQQTSQQTQQGGSDQFQSASQLSTAALNLVSQAVVETVQAVNQTTQTIVQVQIGCLFYCTDTHQTQQASQSNTAVQVVAQGVADATAPVATAVNIVNQFVWQLQIGCLAWCSDTSQEQLASQSNGVVVIPGPAASQDPSPPPPGDPAPAPGDRAPGPGEPAPAPSDPGAVGPIVGRPPRVDPVHVSPVAPPSPPVVTPQRPPAVAVPAPTAPAVTAPSGRRLAPVAPEAGERGRQAVSRVPVGSSSTSGHVAAAVIEPAASHARAVTRGRGARPTAGKISLGSWRVARSLTLPAILSLPEGTLGNDQTNAPDPVLVAVVALALGLLLLTTIRIRTR